MPSPLVTLGPFTGADFKVTPYFVAPDKATAIANADPHTYTNQLAIPYGRVSLLSLGSGTPISATLVPFTTFRAGGAGSAKASITSRIYFYSLQYSGGTTAQGYATQVIVDNIPVWTNFPLPELPAFTEGTQFTDGAYFNNGYQVRFRGWSTATGTAADTVVIPWQINTENPTGTPGTAFTVSLDQTTSEDAFVGPGSYSYAFCYVQHATADTGYSPATPLPIPPESTAQITSPVYVNVDGETGALTPITVSADNTEILINITDGYDTIMGNDGVQYDMALFRYSDLQPVYYFVGWVSQMPAGPSAPAGYVQVADKLADATISSNAQLIAYNDPPPFVIDNTTLAYADTDNKPQVTVTPNFRTYSQGFLVPWKGRMFCFVLYPTLFDPAELVTGGQNSVTLQSQLWFSSLQPWSFDGVDDVLQVGPELTPSNWNFGYPTLGEIVTNIFAYGELEDTPMGIASTGSILAMFKSKSVWVLYGDTAAEFIDRNIVLDMGCIASDSIVSAEGGIFWLAAQGAYFFDGGSPTLLSEPIWNDLESQGQAAMQAAVGWYQNRTYFLNVGSVTYSYYIPTQAWSKVNFGLDAVATSTYPDNTVLGIVGSELVAWGLGTTDLSNPITATWTGPIVDSGARGMAKYYRFMEILAPVASGSANVTLTVDGGAPNGPAAFTTTFDLSKGPTQVISLPDYLTGYTAQLSVSLNGVAGTAIESVVVMGEVKRDITVTSGY